MHEFVRPLVVRVRGLPRSDTSSAEATVRKAISKSSREHVECKISIVPSCDREDELVALVDFPGGLPVFLSSLRDDPFGSWQAATDNEDISFDRHFNGFTQLYGVAGQEDVQVDIIAICGIDGHAYGSWQGRGSTRRMWLRHFLAKDLSSCRVMTYGYNAKISRRGFATADDYSREFLEDLKRVRAKDALQRPVIFVAHSFGGIILARSLIKVMQTNGSDHPVLASLHRATYGFLFFAVPHRGLDVEDMTRIMEEENNPRTGLLQHISVDSTQLRSQLEDFKDITYDRKVVSFFETEQSQRLQRNEKGEWERNGENFTTLEAESAILQLPRQTETRIPLHCDHSAVIKYDSKYDAGYERTISYLKEFVVVAPDAVKQRFSM